MAGSHRAFERQSAGFTLIEILAVAAILALMATFVLPNLGIIRFRNLNDEAKRITAQLELARQRAVMTSIPHRLYIDLDAQAYRLEWLTTEAEARGEEPAWEPPKVAYRADEPLPVAAPRGEDRIFRPLPGQFGSFRHIDETMLLSVLGGGDGWREDGEAAVTFERDGSATRAQIAIEDDSGRTLVLDVLPLADTVRVRDESL